MIHRQESGVILKQKPTKAMSRSCNGNFNCGNVGTLGIGTRREYEYTPEETLALEEIASLLGQHLK